eukprot:GHVS01086324.1.p1 GENE.GHVS01086324.1~~GHVS01086324.1.p1  ORF type:complete len:362 (+),score=43.14 GHVS01086324.1:71-1156(+)
MTSSRVTPVDDVFHHSLDVYLSRPSAPILNPSCVWTDIPVCAAVCSLLLVVRYLTCGTAKNRKRKCWVEAFMEGRGIVRENKIAKFCENLWYSVWHIFSVIFGLYVLFCVEAGPNFSGWFGHHLLRPTGRWYWLATPAEHAGGSTLGWPLLPLSAITKCYYLSELAFWISCCIFLLISAESVRSDFLAMAVHHCVTVCLIAFSYVYSYWRLGIVILVVHDIVDVFLYSAKTVYYTNWNQKTVEIGFVFFAFSYLVARLILFPVYCVWPALNIWDLRLLSSGKVQYHSDVPGGVLLPIALIALLILHAFWFRLIIKMIISALRKPTITGATDEGDIRSDSSEGEDEEPEDIKRRVRKNKRMD